MKSLSVLALTCLCVIGVGCQTTSKKQSKNSTGYLVIAHGSTHDHHEGHGHHHHKQHHGKDKHHAKIEERPWEKSVLETTREVQQQTGVPMEVAFGMWSTSAFQKAVDQLLSQEVTKIHVIPLFVSSHSVVIRAQKYQFGVSPEPPEELQTLKRVTLPEGVSLVYGKPLDDSPYLSRILTKRALSLSKNPEKETLILVAHGPVEDEEDLEWVKTLKLHSERIQNSMAEQGKKFSHVEVLTIRDDAEKEVQQKATQHFRNVVARAQKDQKTALILPALIAKGGIEKRLLKRLDGLSFTYKGEMIAPDEELSKWIKDQIEVKSH